MRQITLITGGCRSGKSAYALELARQHGQPGLFVATCPHLDGWTNALSGTSRSARRSTGPFPWWSKA